MQKIAVLDAKCDDAVIINAVTTFGTSSMDFVGCILCEYSKNPRYEIITFDKKLLKAIESDTTGDCGIDKNYFYLKCYVLYKQLEHGVQMGS